MGGVQAPPARAAGWRCPRCSRVFHRTGQQHSCRTVRLEEHLAPDDAMRPLFDELLARVHREIGAAEIVALPCCIHLAGPHDFLAVLPRRTWLEIRFALGRELRGPRIKRSDRISSATYKHSTDITSVQDLDDELLGWIREAYELGETSPSKGT
jgi:hypothetical protein